MQREKVYNLHKTALLIIAGFVFKIGAILGATVLNANGKHDIHRSLFFLISLFIIHPDRGAFQAASFVMSWFCLRTTIGLKKDGFNKKR